MGLRLRGFLIGMDTERKWQVKEKVSVGDIDETKVRVASAKSPKICSLYSDFLRLCIKKKHNITELFPDKTVL